MRAVVTRVASASVTIDGKINGQIGRGFLVLLGVGPDDTEAQARRLADKVCGCRVFEDENGFTRKGYTHHSIFFFFLKSLLSVAESRLSLLQGKFRNRLHFQRNPNK